MQGEEGQGGTCMRTLRAYPRRGECQGRGSCGEGGTGQAQGPQGSQGRLPGEVSDPGQRETCCGLPGWA